MRPSFRATPRCRGLFLVVAAGTLTSTPMMLRGQPAQPDWRPLDLNWRLPDFDDSFGARRPLRGGAQLPGGPDALVDSHWVSAVSGNWSDAVRWSTNPAAPNNGNPLGTTYHAYLDAAGGAHTITLNSAVALDMLTLNSATATLSLEAGGVLSADSATLTAGKLALRGGTIDGGTLTFNGGLLTASPDATSLLRGVTINGNVQFGDFTVVGGNRFRVQDGLTLGGTLDVGGSSDPYGASLLFEGDQSLTSGTVRFSGDGLARKLAVEGTSTLTIGSAAVVRGGNGQIGSQLLTTGANAVVNQGLILADDSGGRAITVMPSVFTNAGTARATGAGVLTLNAASWTNTGMLEALSGGTLNLGGGFTTAAIGSLTNTGGIVNITGMLDNTASTLTLTPATGNWFLRGGTIQGGTVTQSGAQLRMAGTTSRMNEVTFNGDVDMGTSFSILTLGGSNLFNGTVKLGNNSELDFDQAPVLGAGTIEMRTGRLMAMPSQTLTLTSPVVVNVLQGNNNRMEGHGILNHGRITATGAGTVLNIQSDFFTNDGIVEVLNGASLRLGYLSEPTSGAWSNTGVLRLNNATLTLSGLFGHASLASLERTGGDLRLAGILDNTGNTLALTSSTGSLRMFGGEIMGGQVNVSAQNTLLFDPGGKLRGVTVNGDLELTANDSGVTFYDGATVNGVLRLLGQNATAAFLNTQTWGGGTIELAGTSNKLRVETGHTLTLAPGTWVHGGRNGGMGLTEPSTHLINHGRITSDVAGTTLTASGVTNYGILEVMPASTLVLNGTWSSSGILRANGGTIVMANTMRIAGSTLDTAGGILRLDGTLDNSNATLALNASTGSLRLGGGTINGGTVSLSGGSTLLMTTGTGFGIGGTLRNVTLNGDLTLPTGNMNLEGATNLAGTLRIGGSPGFVSTFGIGGQASVSGGIIELMGSGRQELQIQGETTLSFSPTTIVRGGGSGGPYDGSSIGRRFPGSGVSTLINEGLISANLAGQGLTIESTRFENRGIMEAVNGGRLHITNEAQWKSTGTIRAQSGSTVALGGTFSTPNLGTIQNNGGTIVLAGMLDNSASTLTLNQGTGSWYLSIGGALSGGIKGGQVNLQDGRKLISRSGFGLLESVTVNGDLDFETNGTIAVRNGLVLNGTAHMRNSSQMRFEGNQTFPSGTIAFETGPAGERLLTASDNSTLTLGSAAVVHGGGGTVFTGSSSTIINQGLISSDRNGEKITIHTPRFFNEGTVQAINGGILEFIPPLPFGPGDPPVVTNTGVLAISPESMFLCEGPYIQTGTGLLAITLSAGGFEPAAAVFGGSVVLDGGLRLSLATGFAPAAGQSYRLFDLTGAQLTGGFTQINLPVLGGGLSWEMGSLYAEGTVSVVPAPGTMLLLMSAGLVGRRRLRAKEVGR